MKRSYHHPFIDRGRENENENDNKLENIHAREQTATKEETDNDSIKSVKSSVSQH